MPRVVVLGCGTGVGKSRVSAALLRDLSARGVPCLGLKPIESGIAPAHAPDAAGSEERAAPVTMEPPEGSDARLLSDAGSLRPAAKHPLYALARPVSPHLAAREEGIELDLGAIAAWVAQAEATAAAMATDISSDSAIWTLVETAGGVFSPLALGLSNFDLARALEPAIWVLVAADSLGVLHDTTATLEALRARGRIPDHVLLSQAREPDASTGSNAAELRALGIATVSAVLERNDDRSVSAWVERLIASSTSAQSRA